jgi:hypothetical protein
MLLFGWGSNDNGLQPHWVLLDYDLFQQGPMRDAKGMQMIRKLHDARHLDFRLKPGSASVDKGAVIPNVPDGYSGNAPTSVHWKSACRYLIYGQRNS